MKNREIKKTKVGLALGMGAARGLIHIGALKAIEEYNIKIDFISGTSIGALVGAAYASGMSVNKIENIAINTNWKDLAKLLLPSIYISSKLNTDFLEKQLREWFGYATFNDLTIPFYAVATDIISGKMIVLNKGDLVKAIKSSISLPVIFSPVNYGKYKLIDGGLVNPTPVNILLNKVDKIIAVSVKKLTSIELDAKNKTLKKNGRLDFINEKIQSVLKQQLNLFSKDENDLSNLKLLYNILVIVQNQINELNLQIAKPDILIQPDVSNYKAFEFTKAKEIIEIGYKTTKEELENKKFLLEH